MPVEVGADRASHLPRGQGERTLGVEHDDTAGRLAHHRRGYEFFGAPVGLTLTVDRRSLGGGLIDAGAILQALVLLARARGLDTCPQASFLDFTPWCAAILGSRRSR